jgi:hypothetical protein
MSSSADAMLSAIARFVNLQLPAEEIRYTGKEEVSTGTGNIDILISVPELK